MIKRSVFFFISLIVAALGLSTSGDYNKSLAWLIQGSAPCTTSSYIGPGDIVTYSRFSGVQAYNTAYAASCGPAYDVRRSSDNATMTVNFLTTGVIDIATVSAWAGADTIFITKEYDQTGNGNDEVQASNASQPSLILSGGPGNFPYYQSSGGTLQVVCQSTVTPATGLVSFSVVANHVGGFGGLFSHQNGSSRNRIGNNSGTANRWTLNGSAGTLTATVTNNVWHDAQAVIRESPNGASSFIIVDGVTTNGTVTGSTVNGACGAGSSGAGITQQIAEHGWIDNYQLTPTNASDLRTSARARYGF